MSQRQNQEKRPFGKREHSLTRKQLEKNSQMNSQATCIFTISTQLPSSLKILPRFLPLQFMLGKERKPQHEVWRWVASSVSNIIVQESLQLKLPPWLYDHYCDIMEIHCFAIRATNRDSILFVVALICIIVLFEHEVQILLLLFEVKKSSPINWIHLAYEKS